MSSQTQPQPQKQPDISALLGTITVVVGLVQQVAPIIKQLEPLIKLFGGLFGKKTPKPPVLVPEVPDTPGVPTPIPAPLPSTPQPGEQGRRIAKVVLRIQKAERPNDPGNLYDNPMQMVATNNAFNFGSSFWFDMTAFDDENEEWQGHSIVAADKEYKTLLRVYKDGHEVAYIKGAGDLNRQGQGDPAPWSQQTSDGVKFAQRAWKDSVGMNTRVNILEEGNWKVVGEFDGVPTNAIEFRTS